MAGENEEILNKQYDVLIIILSILRSAYTIIKIFRDDIV